MATYSFTSLSAAARAIERDCRARQKRVMGAVRKAARVTARVVKQDLVPKAFGELAESIHVTDAINGSAVIADAPHAEAVELGSRPHMPPLDPIIRWVQLRGIQGISLKGNIKRHSLLAITPRSAQAEGTMRARASVAHALSMAIGDGNRASRKSMVEWRNRATRAGGWYDPATLAVAKAIQLSIARSGTKPFRFMFRGIHIAMHALDEFVTEAMQETASNNVPFALNLNKATAIGL